MGGRLRGTSESLKYIGLELPVGHTQVNHCCHIVAIIISRHHRSSDTYLLPSQRRRKQHSTERRHLSYLAQRLKSGGSCQIGGSVKNRITAEIANIRSAHSYLNKWIWYTVYGQMTPSCHRRKHRREPYTVFLDFAIVILLSSFEHAFAKALDEYICYSIQARAEYCSKIGRSHISHSFLDQRSSYGI